MSGKFVGSSVPFALRFRQVTFRDYHGFPRRPGAPIVTGTIVQMAVRMDMSGNSFSKIRATFNDSLGSHTVSYSAEQLDGMALFLIGVFKFNMAVELPLSTIYCNFILGKIMKK